MARGAAKVAVAKSEDNFGNDVEEAGPSPQTDAARWAAHAATAAYGLAVLGHTAVLRELLLSTGGEGALFFRLATVQACLTFEAAVYAIGDFSLWRSRRTSGWGLAVLETAARVRLLVSSVAWAWIVPWAAELSCRCGASPPPRGAVLLGHCEAVAMFVSGYFALRELMFLVRGEPPSALDGSVAPKFGDCLPSNALLGGQFRLDKAELEDSGRIVFVPARPRQGLYAAPGLAMLAHLAAGFALALHSGIEMLPWLLLGAGVALLGRKVPGLCPAAAGDGQRRLGTKGSRDVWRLLCRAGEVWWMWCCVNQLRQCQAVPSGWLARCE